MLSQRFAVAVPKLVKRNFGIAVPALQKADDPIAQLFIDKIHEYKSKASSGKLDLPPEIQAEKKRELEKLSKQFGGSGAEMTAFPQFSFTEPKVEVNPVESSG